jgi:hypothetical protein
MKFKIKKNTKVGETRVVSKFAFLPISCKGEMRWLEKVKVRQEYMEVVDFTNCPVGSYSTWINLEFVDF